MKSLLIYLILSFITIQLNSQVIKGKVIDSSSGEPLIYASIGIINTSLGAITDENGNFALNVDGQRPDAVVRFSMISYAPQTFKIRDLSREENMINLVSTPIQLKMVEIKPSGKFRKIGNTDYNRKVSSCGWGGSHYGKGNEIGLKIELGTLPVQLQRIHIRIHRQGFDSSLFRLHIRNIRNNEPGIELLTKNIYITLTKETGWDDIDLSKYNIVLSGDVALTLEWVKIFGVNKNREMNINNEMWSQYVLFKNKKQGCTYTRWGAEAKWNVIEKLSPAIYLTIQE